MPARPELLTEVSPPAYHSLGIVTIRSARILAHEDEPRDPVRRSRAGSLTRRCRGVVAGVDLTPTRFRLRRRRDRARRTQGPPPPPPRRDRRRRSRPPQGGTVAVGSGEVARPSERRDRATPSGGAPARADALSSWRSCHMFDGTRPPGYAARGPPTNHWESMMKTRLMSVIALIAVLSPPAAAQGPAPKGAPKELRVGIVTLLSGPASSTFGIPAKKAADAWVEKINEAGGIGGVKVVPVLTDEAGPGDKVVAEFRRLAADEKVDLVIGYISSANCVAVPAVAEELRLLTVLFDCGTTRVFEEAKYKYVFRTAAHTGIDGIGAARYLLA